MPKSISASVGLKGVNKPIDVLIVQDLINKVPVTQGGPKVKLELDGKSGAKTRNAIHTFQLHHFGWSGADARVDRDGPTLFKLNEFDPAPPLPKPPELPPAPEPLSSDFAIVPAFQGNEFPPDRNSSHFTYLVIDLTNNRERVYQLVMDGVKKPVNGKFEGFFARFKPRKPAGVSGFEGIGGYMTSEQPVPGGKQTQIRSQLLLFPPEGGSGISIPMKTHLLKKGLGGALSITTAVHGDFKLVR